MNSIKKLNEVLFLINKKHTGNLCRYVFLHFALLFRLFILDVEPCLWYDKGS